MAEISSLFFCTSSTRFNISGLAINSATMVPSSEKGKWAFNARSVCTVLLLKASPLHWLSLGDSQSYSHCGDPQARPDPIGESEPKPQGRPFNSFYLHFYYFFFFKSVVTQIPGSTQRADPNWSPVYSDVFNYLIKTFSLCYFSLGF